MRPQEGFRATPFPGIEERDINVLGGRAVNSSCQLHWRNIAISLSKQLMRTVQHHFGA